MGTLPSTCTCTHCITSGALSSRTLYFSHTHADKRQTSNERGQFRDMKKADRLWPFAFGVLLSQPRNARYILAEREGVNRTTLNLTLGVWSHPDV